MLFRSLGYFGFSALRMLPIMFGRLKLPDPRLQIYAQMVFVAVISYGISAQFVSLYAMESVFYTIAIGLIILKLVWLQKLADDQRETEEMLTQQREMGYSNVR